MENVIYVKLYGKNIFNLLSQCNASSNRPQSLAK